MGLLESQRVTIPIEALTVDIVVDVMEGAPFIVSTEQVPGCRH